MPRILQAFVGLLALLATAATARADFTFTQGTGQTGFSFTAATGGTSLCAASVTHCFASVPINTAGAPLGVTANPFVVSFPSAQAVSGTVTAAQATAANLNATVVGTGTFATQSAITAASGSIASGALAAGSMVDFITTRGTKAPGTAAANSILGGCLFNAAVVTGTDGQQAASQCDAAFNTKVAYGITTATLTGWTSATAGNSTQTLMVNHGAPALVVQLDQTTTISAGAVTFEGTYDGTNWVSVPVAQVLNPATFANLTNPYTLVASTNQPFLILTQGYQSVRVRLSTAITGSATVTPFVALLNYNPVLGALLNPLAAGDAAIGRVKITDGTNVGAVKAASTAAAATDPAQVVSLSPNQGTPAQVNQYPFGATPITASNTGTTGATTATLAGTSGKTTYMCWSSVRANATATTTVANTITGVITGTLTREMWVPANTSGLGVDEMIYNPCVPASATNTGIAIVSGAPGTGGVVSVNGGGYQL